MSATSGETRMESQLHQVGTQGSLIVTAIARFGSAQALADDRQTWTYAELGRQIGKAITVLREAGLGRGDGIAILSANRCELIAIEYAALLMGMRYTALHPMAAQDNHEFILADCEASALFVDGDILGYPLDGLIERITTLNMIFSFGPLSGARDVGAAMQIAAASNLVDEAKPSDIVRLFYTGGTTGRPKGVLWSHRTMVMATILQATDWDLPGTPNFLAVTPVSHASGAVIPTVLMQGGRARLSKGFNAERFAAIVEQERINCAFLVPTMIYVLLDHMDGAQGNRVNEFSRDEADEEVLVPAGGQAL